MPIVESGASHRLIIGAKAKFPDQVQARSRGSTQPRNVASIWWNLRLKERPMQTTIQGPYLFVDHFFVSNLLANANQLS